ncbi:hypothetical protein [Burkholderia ubonensis]|uniref:hypothetical protein n=1 Tax=Burkholderia ubonensis TaxID=101571 RepID=UPI0018E01F1B|nr:hypothetical protein [Burkholderia ubonensis]
MTGLLRSDSDFGKQLSEHVKKAVQVDFSNLGIPGYNDLILKIILQRVDASLNEQIEKHVTSQLDELLAPAPEEIKLSELVADFIKFQADKQLYSCSCDLPERITLLVETSGSYSALFSLPALTAGAQSDGWAPSHHSANWPAANRHFHANAAICEPGTRH